MRAKYRHLHQGFEYVVRCTKDGNTDQCTVQCNGYDDAIQKARAEYARRYSVASTDLEQIKCVTLTNRAIGC